MSSSITFCAWQFREKAVGVLPFLYMICAGEKIAGGQTVFFHYFSHVTVSEKGDCLAVEFVYMWSVQKNYNRGINRVLPVLFAYDSFWKSKLLSCWDLHPTPGDVHATTATLDSPHALLGNSTKKQLCSKTACLHFLLFPIWTTVRHICALTGVPNGFGFAVPDHNSTTDALLVLSSVSVRFTPAYSSNCTTDLLF